MKTKEHICQVYDFTSIREVVMEKKKEEEAKVQSKLSDTQLDQDNITLDLFTIRDMILNGFDPSSPEDIAAYGRKVGYEIDWDTGTWNPTDD
jgi:hypothetical protein